MDVGMYTKRLEQEYYTRRDTIPLLITKLFRQPSPLASTLAIAQAAGSSKRLCMPLHGLEDLSLSLLTVIISFRITHHNSRRLVLCNDLRLLF